MKKFKTVFYSIKDDKLNGSSPVRIAVISDLHNASFGDDGRELVRAIRDLEPDAVVSCGDLLTAKNGRLKTDKAIETVCEIAKGCPVYVADGNHELRMKQNRKQYGNGYEKFMNTLLEAGVTSVNEATVRLNLPAPVYVSGYAGEMRNYKRRGRTKISKKDLQERLGEAPADGYNILLAHHPDFARAYAEWGADLTLSGHVHGGMVRVPFLGGVFGSTYMPFPRYDRGMFETDGRRMIISAGLGAHTIPIRIFNPPQLLVIELAGTL